MNRTSFTIITIVFIGAILSSCSGNNEIEEVEVENTDQESEEIEYNGFNILETSCFSCHSPNINAPETSAPNIASIKTGYKSTFSSEQEFVDAMVSFLVEPSEANAIMTDAVEKYGIMPNMGYNSKMVAAAATYLYNTPIEDSMWFSKSYELEKAKNVQDPSEMSYVDRGLQFALAVKSVLGKNLKGKIQSEGTNGAMDFCNVNAIHLTDSMAVNLGVKVKRVSDKNRNPNNGANEDELAIIESFKNQLANGEEITPTTKEVDNTVIGYYPILTNEMCLQCHGTEENVTQETSKLISNLYPQDKARGYGVNQLRGIWVIEMEK